MPGVWRAAPPALMLAEPAAGRHQARRDGQPHRASGCPDNVRHVRLPPAADYRRRPCPRSSHRCALRRGHPTVAARVGPQVCERRHGHSASRTCRLTHHKLTLTGTYRGTPLTVISIGMGFSVSVSRAAFVPAAAERRRAPSLSTSSCARRGRSCKASSSSCASAP